MYSVAGIVAWAISVEVASGGQNALGGSTNYRKPQQHQQQQSQQKSTLYHQFRRPGQQQQAVERAERDSQLARMPVAAAVIGARPAPARRRPEFEEAPVKESNSETSAQLDQQQQVSREKKSKREEDSNSGGKSERQASSALLLTVSWFTYLFIRPFVSYSFNH